MLGFEEATWVGLGAILAGAGSVLSGWAALRSARNEKIGPVSGGGPDAGGDVGSAGSDSGDGELVAGTDDDDDGDDL